VERLQTHADTSRVALGVSDLLDRLVLPEWPDSQRSGGGAIGNLTSLPVKGVSPVRKPFWILSLQTGRDEGNELPFWIGVQALRRNFWNHRTAIGHMEIGLAQVDAEATSGRLTYSEAIAKIEAGLGHWVATLNGWLGTDQDFRADMGLGGSLTRQDTFAIGRITAGPEGRVSWSRSNWIGVSGRWDAPSGVALFGSVRWRQDPEIHIEEGTMHFQSERSRIQGLASLTWLVAFGSWRLGPQAEVDGRASTDSDLWMDSTGIKRPSRQEVTWSAGGVFSVTRPPRWSLRFRPSWVFATSDPVLGEGVPEKVQGLRLSLDGVLVL
jgi:hypothetical protein